MAGEAPAGWHADPYGRHEYRYFDGQAWTNDVSDGGTQSIDDPNAGTPAVVPPAVVPSQAGVPRATAQTPAVVVHHRSRWPWVLLGIFIFMVVGFGGCAIVSVVVLNEAADEISEAQERHAISQTQFESISIGTSRAAVLQTLGKSPTTTSSFKSEAEGDVNISSDCIYYWESGETFGNWYQFCFDAAGNLRLKTQS